MIIAAGRREPDDAARLHQCNANAGSSRGGGTCLVAAFKISSPGRAIGGRLRERKSFAQRAGAHSPEHH